MRAARRLFLRHSACSAGVAPVFRGSNCNLGTIFRFDIAPSPPVFQQVTQTGGVVTLTWDALAGRSYQVRFKTDLTQTDWRDAGGLVTATNTSVTATDIIGSDRQRFYRVVLLP
jgi:hypothetical protein